MSNKESAKNKLLDSMRISKGGASQSKSEPAPVKKSTKAKAAPKKSTPKKKTRKPVAKKPVTKKSAPKSSAKAASTGNFSSEHGAVVASDRYQSAGRTWPD